MSLYYVSKDANSIIEIPQLDENGVPTQKLPECPKCKEGELGVLNADVIMCYSCSSYYYYREVTK